MRVYLDNSTLNRPFDDQSFSKIRLEAMATFFVLELIEKKKVDLIDSSVVEYENSKNPFFERKIWVSVYLSKAKFFQEINPTIKKRAKEIGSLGISAIDSLHLASAEIAKADYFLTCDQRVIKKYKGPLMVADPIEFVKMFKEE